MTMKVKTKVKWRGDIITEAQQRGAVKGVGIAAEHLLGEARKLVPHEEGTLERSGVASVDEGEMKAAVSFDTPYAVRQHEELTWKHDEGRTAKYLETPADTEQGIMRDLVAAQIRRALS
jgi:hypothetical protein